MKNEITGIEQYVTVMVLYRVVITLTLDEILNSETTTVKAVVSPCSDSGAVQGGSNF